MTVDARHFLSISLRWRPEGEEKRNEDTATSAPSRSKVTIRGRISLELMCSIMGIERKKFVYLSIPFHLVYNFTLFRINRENTFVPHYTRVGIQSSHIEFLMMAAQVMDTNGPTEVLVSEIHINILPKLPLSLPPSLSLSLPLSPPPAPSPSEW